MKNPLLKSVLICSALLAFPLLANTHQINQYRIEADKGNTKAMVQLGECYLTGKGVEKNEAEAFKLFYAAADKGDAHAMYQLGICYLDGKGVAMNSNEAIKLFHTAADKDDTKALCKLAGCYLYGKGVKQDTKEALSLYKSAIEKGDTEAMVQLGKYYKRGIRNLLNEDTIESIKLFNLAAEKGDTEAIYELGVCHAFGIGVKKDQEESFKYFQKAANNGNAHAMYWLGSGYLRGWYKAENNVAEGIKLLSSAVDNGCYLGAIELGKCYMEGKGVEKDKEKAMKWFSTAVECYQKAAKPIPESLKKNIQKLGKQTWISKSNTHSLTKLQNLSTDAKFNGVEFGKKISDFGNALPCDNSNDRRFMGKAGEHKLSYWWTKYKPAKTFRRFTIGKLHATWESKVVYEVTYEFGFDRNTTTAADREEVKQTIEALNRKYGVYHVKDSKTKDGEDGFCDSVERFELPNMVVELKYTSEGRFDRAQMILTAWDIGLKERATQESLAYFKERQDEEASKVKSGGEDAL